MNALTSSDRSGFPLLVALLFSITVGGIIGGVTGFVTTLPSGFAVAFVLPGVLIGAVAGAVAVLAGIAADQSVRRRKGDSAVARIVSTATSATAGILAFQSCQFFRTPLSSDSTNC
jgi:gas vesicle protein